MRVCWFRIPPGSPITYVGWEWGWEDVHLISNLSLVPNLPGSPSSSERTYSGRRGPGRGDPRAQRETSGHPWQSLVWSAECGQHGTPPLVPPQCASNAQGCSCLHCHLPPAAFREPVCSFTPEPQEISKSWATLGGPIPKSQYEIGSGVRSLLHSSNPASLLLPSQ